MFEEQTEHMPNVEEELFTPVTDANAQVNPQGPVAAELTGLAMTLDDSDEFSEEKYRAAVAQTEAMGDSDLMQDVITKAAMYDDALQTEVAQNLLLDPNLSHEDKQTVLMDYESYMNKPVHYPDLRQQQFEKIAATSQEPVELSKLDRQIAAERDTLAILSEAIEDAQQDSDLMDTLGRLIPFNDSTAWNGMASAMFGDDWDMLESAGTVAMGAVMADHMAQKLEEYPREDWAEMVKRGVDYMRTESGIWGANQEMAAEFMYQMSERISGMIDTEQTTGYEIINGAIGILDVTGAGQLMELSVRGAGRLMRGSTASQYASANPAKAATLDAAAITNDEVAVAVGTKSEDVAIRSVLPDAPSTRVEHVEQGVTESLDYLHTQASRDLMTEEMKRLDSVAPVREQDVLDYLARETDEIEAMSSGRLSIENSTIKTLPDGKIRTELTIVPGENKLYKNPTVAEDAAREIYGPNAIISIERVEKGTRTVRRNVSKNTTEEATNIVLDDINTSLKNLASKRLNRKQLKEVAGKIKNYRYDIRAATKGRAEKIETKKLEGDRRLDKTVRKEVLAAEKAFRANAQNKLRELNARMQAHDEYKELARNARLLKEGKTSELTGEAKRLFAEATRKGPTEETTPIVGYRAVVSHDHRVNEFDKLVFGDNYGLSDATVRNGYLQNPASRFANEFTAMARAAVDRAAGLRNRFENQLKPFLKLGQKSKNNVMSYIVKGDREGIDFKPSELHGLNKKEIESYQSVRRHELMDWSLHDRKEAIRLQAGNNSYYHIDLGNEKIKTFVGAPLKRETGVDKTDIDVFNPLTGAGERLTKDQIKEIYDGGGSIVKLDTRFKNGREHFDYMVARKDGKVTTTGIPDRGVTNYLPGHIRRIYKDQYFITATTKGKINGKPDDVVSVRFVAPTRQAAEAFVEKMNARVGGKVYDWQLDSKLQGDALAEMERLVRDGVGTTKHTHRGRHLRSTEGGEASIHNVVEALERSATSLSNAMSIDRVRDSLKNRWINDFGELTNGLYPTSAKNIVDKKGSTEMSRAAKEWYDYIEMLGAPTNSERELMKKGYLQLAEYLDGTVKTKFGKDIAEAIRHAEATPTGLARMAGFVGMIALNPGRQLLLNSQQLHYLAPLAGGYAVKPWGLAADLAGLPTFLLGRNTGNKLLEKAGAKAMGVDPDTAWKMWQAFKKSGLPAAVDEHAFIRNMVQSTNRELSTNLAMNTMRAGRQAFRKVIRGARAVGFDPGERLNLLGSFFVAKERMARRLKKEGKEIDWDDLATRDAIAADARQLGLGMNRADDYKYQHGWLSAPTQFMAVQHKVFNDMYIPFLKTEGATHLTKTERKLLTVGQIAFWGSTSYGLHGAYKMVRDSLGWEPNEALDAIIEAGLGEYAANAAIEWATDERSDLALSKNFAPGGGYMHGFKDKIDILLGNSINAPWTLAVGPSANMFNRANQIGQTLNLIFHDHTLDTPDKIMKSIEEFGRLSSGMNNALKYNAWQVLGTSVSKSMDPIVEKSWAEANAHRVFGIQTNDEQAYYDFMGRSGGKFEAPEIDQEAKRLLAYAKDKVLNNIEPQVASPSDVMSLEDRLYKIVPNLWAQEDDLIRHALALHGPDVGTRVAERMLSLMDSEWKEGKSDGFLRRLGELVSKGRTDDDLGDLKIMIKNSNLQNKEEVLETLDAAILDNQGAIEEMKRGIE